MVVVVVVVDMVGNEVFFGLICLICWQFYND